jgi:hypothetical protein
VRNKGVDSFAVEFGNGTYDMSPALGSKTTRTEHGLFRKASLSRICVLDRTLDSKEWVPRSYGPLAFVQSV